MRMKSEEVNLKQISGDNSNIDQSSKNANFELLRVVAMLMIIIMHYLGQGGELSKSVIFSSNYYMARILLALSIIGVNLYVLISGYYLVNSRFKFKKIIIIYIQVVFYSITIYTILCMIGLIKFSTIVLLKKLLPISTKEYWFVTTYLALYLLFPYLNVLINNLSKKKLEMLIIILIIIFSVWPTFYPIRLTLDTTGGYGIIWFICLYFIAAYIRLYGIRAIKIKRLVQLYILAACWIATSGFIIDWICLRFNLNKEYWALFYKYDSLFVLIESLFLFLAFTNLQIKSRLLNKIILNFSGLTFGIYLIHVQPQLHVLLWTKILYANKYVDSQLMILDLILKVIFVFLACSAIEWARKKIFKRVENSNKLNQISFKINDIFI